MYQEYRPSHLLANYIEAYWTIKTGEKHKSHTQRILPDTCTDIIINLGSTVTNSKNNETLLQADKSYFVGTMTRFSDVTFQADTNLFGIRFKPSALFSLLGFPLSGTSNQTIELSNREFNFMHFFASAKIPGPQKMFDSYFANKITKPDSLVSILESIQGKKGLITIAELAKKHNTTERQLERMFQTKTGVTVKELCKQTRLLHAMRLLKDKSKMRSIFDIAFEAGFYDHSHLSKDIKTYTGYNPSDL